MAIERSLEALSLAAVALLGAACASSHRSQTLGSAPIVAAPTTSQTATQAAVAVDASPDPLRVEYSVHLPRALLVRVVVHCPGSPKQTRTIGQTWESYYAQRSTEIRREREQARRTQAAIVSATVGGLQGRADLRGPIGTVRVEGQVESQAVGNALIPTDTSPIVLPPGDLGARTFEQSIPMTGGKAGVCTLAIQSDDPSQDLRGITGLLTITRLVDPQRKERIARLKHRKRALEIRSRVSAQLVLSGADHDHRARIDAEKRAQLEHKKKSEVAPQHASATRTQRVLTEDNLDRHARVQAQNRARVQAARRARLEREREAKIGREVNAALDAAAAIEESNRARVGVEASVEIEAGMLIARETRSRVVAGLVACGADPYARARRRREEFLRAQAKEHASTEAKRDHAEAQRRAELERRRREEVALAAAWRTRESMVAWLVANGADPDYRRRKDEADLARFEARARADRERRLRAHLAADTRVDVDLETPDQQGALAPVTAVPPPPPVSEESRPPAPSPTAVWVAGHYQWTGQSWSWLAGSWTIPPLEGAIWVAPVEISIGGRFVSRPGTWRSREGRKLTPQRRPRQVDHR